MISSAWVSFHFLSASWNSAAAILIDSRYRAAESKSPAFTAASFLPFNASIASCREVSDLGLADAPILRRAPVSSIASIALSGSCLAGR